MGKTALALALAERVPLEVVSADSRTVYRWMDIGTAKPTPEERHRVPHHLLDVVDPDEPYTLAVYQRQALAAIERIARRGRLPVLVGGAGLYVSAVCDGLSLPDVPPNPEFRAGLEALAAASGWQPLQEQLRQVDPESAARIEPRNVRRVIRALEVFHATGRKFSDWQTPAADWPIQATLIGLRLDRDTLNARIDARIQTWLSSGFVAEVRNLLERGYAPNLPSMSGLGYREIAAYLSGSLDAQAAQTQLQHATHQYAKRQMTWFGARAGITWFDAQSVSVDQVLEATRPSM